MLIDKAAHDVRLARWLSELQVDSEAGARRRRRSLLDQAAESASLDGVLAGLAEARKLVTIETGVERLRGQVVGAGLDFAAVRTESGTLVLVVLDAVEAIRTDGPMRVPEGSAMDVRLLHLLGPAATERPTVSIRTRMGATYSGMLRAVGTDVVALDVEGRTAWIPADTLVLLRL